jgi:hypothetical protein
MRRDDRLRHERKDCGRPIRVREERSELLRQHRRVTGVETARDRRPTNAAKALSSDAI